MGRLLLSLLLAAACACAAGRVLSEECSGYEPAACRRLSECKTCFDGRRVDCYSSKEVVYGNIWCEPSGAANDACSGKSAGACGSTSGCVFCKSAAVGDQCYTSDEAKKLPPAIFSCAWKTAY